MIRKSIVIVYSCFASLTCLAQGNTFPANGNVGIGVAPATKLHVRGATRIEREPGGNNHFLLSFDANGNYFTSDDPGFNHKHMYLQVVSRADGTDTRNMYFRTGLKDGAMNTRMSILYDGRVGIGTTNPQAKLSVNGNILANEVKVKTDISVPDYVFEPDYELPTLSEIDDYIKEHKHLPEIPSAADIQRDGLDLAEMNLLLLKKVEELTLHLIEKEKSETNMKRTMEQMATRLNQLESLVEKLDN